MRSTSSKLEIQCRGFVLTWLRVNFGGCEYNCSIKFWMLELYSFKKLFFTISFYVYFVNMPHKFNKHATHLLLRITRNVQAFTSNDNVDCCT